MLKTKGNEKETVCWHCVCEMGLCESLATARTGIRFSAFWTGMEENAGWRKMLFTASHFAVLTNQVTKKTSRDYRSRQKNTCAMQTLPFYIIITVNEKWPVCLSGILGDHAVGTWFIRDEYAMLDFFFFFFFFWGGAFFIGYICRIIYNFMQIKLK